MNSEQRTERALRESEARLALALEVSGQALYDLDLTTGKLSLSEAHIGMLERDPSMLEVDLDTWTGWLHPQDHDGVLVLYEECVCGRRSEFRDVDARFRSGSGIYKWLRSVGRVIEWDKAGRPLRVLGTHLDITDRKEAEEALRLTQVAVDRAVVGIYWFDADGRLVYVNDEACRSVGYRREELIGASAAIFDPGFDSERHTRLWDELRRSGSAVTFETRHRRQDGRFIDVEVACNYISLADREYNVAFARDISARKAAETRLKDSEARFSTAFHRSPAPTTISDLETHRLIDVNDRWQSATGFRREEVVGRTVAELGHVADPALLASGYEEIGRSGLLRDYPVSVIRKDGESRDYLWSAERVQLNGLDVLLSALQDVTDRNRAEAALRQSEERFAMVFHSSPVAMVISSIADGRVLDVNERWLKTVGLQREEMIGRTTKQIGIWDDPSDRDRIIDKLRKTGPFQDEPLVIRATDGERHEILWSTEIITLGEEVVLLSSVHDITAQKRAERALQESEMRLRTAIESIPFDFYVLDSERRFVLQNTVSKTRVGNFIGRHTAQLPFNQDQLDHFECMLDRALAGALVTEESVLIEGSETRHFDNVIAPIKDEEWVRGVVGLNIDITERRRAESELHQYREHLEELVQERTAALERAMRQLVQAEKLAALGNLVAGVAHELNTPLGNALMVANTLGDDIRDLSDGIAGSGLRRKQLMDFLDRGREAVTLLERNTARAADLVGHFKAVAVDQTSARRRCFNLKQTLEEMLSTLNPRIKRTAHRIELDIPSHIELDSHPGPLEQILTNLIENSLIHGFVGIDAGSIKITAQTPDTESVTLEYADDGVGIAPEARARIFDPFYTTCLGQGGSGLGLYIVYNLITGLLGGTIEVVRPPNAKGASFRMNLPRIAPERKP